MDEKKLKNLRHIFFLMFSTSQTFFHFRLIKEEEEDEALKEFFSSCYLREFHVAFQQVNYSENYHPFR